MDATLLGILAAVIAGVMNGSFATPMKKTTKWEWENIWLMWAVFALVIIPTVFAFLAVPDLCSVLGKVESKILWRTFLFGIGWGLGSTTFGLGLHLVGLSLGFSMIMGLTAVAGALVPILVFAPGDIFKTGGFVILGGLLFTILGVTLCAIAGIIREKSRSGLQGVEKKSNFKLGFIVCMISGVFNAMLNFSFVFGSPIAEAAKAAVGDDPTNLLSTSPIWMIGLAGGFIPNLCYTVYLLIRKKTYQKFQTEGTGSYWLWAVLMAAIWTFSVMIYGAGASKLGKVGGAVAWVILMAMAVLMGNFWGVVHGEWKDTPKKARARMVQGSLLLIGSIVLVSLGNYLL